MTGDSRYSVTAEGFALPCEVWAGHWILYAPLCTTALFVNEELTVWNAPRCQHCFCKYHCAGDCPAKRTAPEAERMIAYRCAINRRLTLDLIEEVLLAADEAAYLRAMARRQP